MFGNDDLVKGHKPRLDLIGNIIFLSFAIILARLWYLQIYKGEVFRKYSIQNRLRKEVVPAPRGMIFDRNTNLLVNNVPRFDAVVTPQYLTNKKETIKKLAQILTMDSDAILKILQKNSFQASYRPVIIKKNISQKEVAIIETEALKLPGVSVNTFISRQYKDKEIGGHLLGYISEISQKQLPKFRKRDDYPYRLGDFIGQAGLEEEFDLLLRGEDGFEFKEVDARGRMKRKISGKNNEIFGGIENKPARAGLNIRLTIDRDMQLTAYKALEGKVGAVVAVDVQTGEILTMVSRPSFDPTKFSKGLTKKYWQSLVNDDRNPLRDRTIQEHYSPGSTFKTFTALAALEEKIVTADEQVACGPTFRLGRRVFHDWKRGGHGLTDVYKSLKRSVDVYFYKIGVELDIDILADYARMFGLGKKTSIDLPREIPGLIPTKEWKKKRFGEEWQLGETLSCVIGQSYVLTTPLQLAMSYAAIANGGKLYRPIVVKEVFSNSGDVVQSFEPKLVSTIDVSDSTFKAIKKGLYQVVNEQGGTAWWFRGTGIRMAGKTGTSQVRSMTSTELFSKCEEMPYKSRHHGLFVGFAPFDNPRIAVAAVVEHGCHGSTAASPIVRDVITEFMKEYEKETYGKYAAEDKKAWQDYWRKRKAAEEAKKKKEEAEETEG